MTNIVYLSWLIPCVLSFTTSCLVILNVFTCERIRYNFFQQICVLFAIADMIQTSVTFLGDYRHYESDNNLCGVQVYGLAFGLNFKLATVLVINGTSWYVIENLTIPNNKNTILTMAMVVASILSGASVVFRTSKVYCEDLDYENLSSSEEKAIAYTLFVIAFYYVSLFIVLMLCLAISRKLKHMHFRSTEYEKDINDLVTRLQVIPFCLVICCAPLATDLLRAIVNGSPVDRGVLMDSICGAGVSSNGFLVGVLYFYNQKRISPYLTCPTNNTCSSPPRHMTDGEAYEDYGDSNQYLGSDSQYTFNERLLSTASTVSMFSSSNTFQSSGEYQHIRTTSDSTL